MNRAFLCIGSNVGERKENIIRSLQLLNEYDQIEIKKVSSIYETKPYGVSDQPEFYNLAVELNTSYSPVDLLMVLKTTENLVGRKPTSKWGPREIDLDLVLYENEVLNEEKLKLPHPGVFNRDFFLKPLLELDAELVDPVHAKKLKDYLKLIETNHIINKMEFNLNEIIGS
ncbi:MAG: 2-amino-4-hydroxy-6-hydroxymethyldihydropteridine diphosphokinase [Ignavibacteria bacterium]|nr:MAG: 2-amino-4-hydroxy-6-hydroxymethyldihydropteridine diphosphokinase [Ignavibacteria bacterium]